MNWPDWNLCDSPPVSKQIHSDYVTQAPKEHSHNVKFQMRFKFGIKIKVTVRMNLIPRFYCPNYKSYMNSQNILSDSDIY